MAQPSAIAAVVVWRCSDATSFVTGTAFAIDGGWGTTRARAVRLDEEGRFPMSVEANATVVLRYFHEVLRQNKYDVVEEIFAEDCVLSVAFLPRPFRGAATMKAMAAHHRTAFPDFTLVIDDVVSDEDKVVVRWTLHGTFTVPFQHVAPTGKPVSYSLVGIYRLDAGKIAEYWDLPDRFGLLQQLGALPDTLMLARG